MMIPVSRKYTVKWDVCVFVCVCVCVCVDRRHVKKLDWFAKQSSIVILVCLSNYLAKLTGLFFFFSSLEEDT